MGGEDAVKKYEQEQAGGGQQMDPFAQFFGHKPKETQGPNINLQIRATLEEIYNGLEHEIIYTRQTVCPHCMGSGADDPEAYKKCGKCKGKGKII